MHVASSSASTKKQALQDHILTLVQGRRLAGVAMGVGKTLIGLRDMARILVESELPKDKATPLLFAAPTQAILDSWSHEAHKFGLAHLLDHITFTTYCSLSKTLSSSRYHKLYLDECHALKDSHELGLKAHFAGKNSILGLTGTPPAQVGSEKGRLVVSYWTMLVDYTTNEAVLAGLLNDYRLVVHRLPMRRLPGDAAFGQPVYDQRARELSVLEHRLANAAQDKLPVETLCLLRMQALMHYPGKGRYMVHLAS
jgi:superfamily II DNA or RNA helicase